MHRCVDFRLIETIDRPITNKFFVSFDVSINGIPVLDSDSEKLDIFPIERFYKYIKLT